MKTYLAAFALAAMAATSASAQDPVTPPLLGGTGLTAGTATGVLAGAVILGVIISDDDESSSTTTTD